jgi:uncharacterized protein (TIGR02231 family)
MKAKYFFSGFLCLSAFWTGVFAAEITAESKITTVTVYPNTALLTRSATLKLDAGEHKVAFAGIIPALDEGSLRVSGSGSAEVKILGAQVKKEFLKETADARTRQLQEEIEKLQDERNGLEGEVVILGEEKKFLGSVQLFSEGQIPKDLVTRMPPAKELDDTLKFLDTRLKDNFAQAAAAGIKIREIAKKIDLLRRELADISGPNQKSKRSIVVELEVLRSGSMDLSVSYLVGWAGWQPLYDARADFEKANVELVSYGIVTQNTGEDWDGIEMCLSTAKPAIGGMMPEVTPWLLRPYEPVRQQRHLAKGALTEFKQADSAGLALEAPARSKPEERYAVPQEKGIAVVYKLPRRASIKSDGTEHKLPVSAQLLKADFEYSAFPRVAPSAYLGSRVKNADNLQLLAGRVNIFLEGDFVGKSAIGNIGPGEEFDLYLGVDENVKVKRELIEKKVDETLIAGIPSPNKRTDFTYKLSVENYKARAIKVKLLEAVPIAQDDRIKAKIERVSLEPKEKDWKDKKGVWLWELGLEPEAKKEVTLTYIIEHPRGMQVEGL